MSTSSSSGEYNDETLGMFALGVGQQHLNGVEHMPMHTLVRFGHQYMLELINEHLEMLFNKIRIYRPCFNMLTQVLKQERAFKILKNMIVEEQVLIFLYIICQPLT